jgi:hypothetical protein
VEQATGRFLKERSRQIDHGIGDAAHPGTMDLIASSFR